MDQDPASPRWRRRLVLRSGAVLTLSVFLAAFTASQIRLFLRATGDDAPWARLFLGQLIWWLLWAALVPLVVFGSRRYALDSGRLLPRALCHVGLAIVFGLLQTALRVASLPLIVGNTSLRWGHEMAFAFATYFHWNLLIYALVVAGEHAFRYRSRSRERELQASRLEERLARAELEALRTRLHPHFLFNALSTIAELVHEAPERAEEAIMDLSELLRAVLKSDEALEVPLEQELGFVKGYLRIEQARFDGRLRVRWTIAPETLKASVPSLVLQPLVENAVRHGISARPEGGELHIASSRREGRLELTVSDDGAGLGGGSPRWRTGLDTTRARLERLYRDEQLIALEPRPGGGATARIVIPFQILETT
jgi:two-component system LytT family sensor kinase